MRHIDLFGDISFIYPMGGNSDVSSPNMYIKDHYKKEYK